MAEQEYADEEPPPNWPKFQRTHPIRLEPKPWTGRERRRKRLPEWTGTVVAKSPNGIKAVDDGEWLNFTKDEWRDKPFDEVEKGDKVRITYSKADNGRTYIYTVENLSHPGGPEAPVGTRPTESPFPPEEEFPGEAAAPPGHPLVEESPPAFAVTPDATSEPAEWAVDKDHSIVRQTCIKAAAMALQHSPSKGEKLTGEITYLAGVLEDWCWR